MPIVPVALCQLNASDDPNVNLAHTLEQIDQAAGAGAKFVLTPEVTNCISGVRAHQNRVLHTETTDPTLQALSNAAHHYQIWLLVGSLALKTENTYNAPLRNRSFLFNPKGKIVARYDKIHMFDVDLGQGERYCESAVYQPGNRAVLAQTDFAQVGLTICYDVRFAYLYRALAQAGAKIITVPAAFSRPTGQAHWHILLRARAIETGCYILAPAQCGSHQQSIPSAPARSTYGHSLIVAPWGEIIAEAGGETPDIILADLDLTQVTKARQKVPSLTQDKPIPVPIKSIDP